MEKMENMEKPKEDSKGEGIDPPVLFLGELNPEDDSEGWVEVVKRSNPKARPANLGQAKKVVKKGKGVKKDQAKVRQIT